MPSDFLSKGTDPGGEKGQKGNEGLFSLCSSLFGSYLAFLFINLYGWRLGPCWDQHHIEIFRVANGYRSA